MMTNSVWRFTGSKSRAVIVGPTAGIDIAVLNIGRGKVLVANCDPISLIPSLGPEDSAAMSLYEVASDVATSGQPPRYVMLDLNLPPTMSDKILGRYWKAVDKVCRQLGLSILGGHTGRFEGCDYTIIGSATMWTTCGKDEFLTSAMANHGDDLIFTKSAAYGATSVLTRAFPKTVRKHLGQSLFEKAWQYLQGTNTVNDSLSAVKAGIHERGVTAIHDVTEGGSFAGLVEIAHASRLGGTLDLESIPVSEETLEISKLFKIDPLTALGEGSLLIATRPNRTRRVIDILQSRGTKATVIGQLSSRTRALFGTSRKGRVKIRVSKRDPYWAAYWRALRKGWS
jgi:hydrogenase expression/formation protein HypE